MTGPSFAVVCTTIGDGSFLKHYAKALEGADATMYVIPDRKTPAPLYAAVEDYRAQGLAIQCPDLNEQTAFLAKLGAPDGFFPWDTDHRRNVGYLMAYESGADIVISIDDDNLPLEGWALDGGSWSAGHWLKDHAWVVAPPIDLPVITDGNHGEPWFWNPVAIDHGNAPITYWPRGFPYAHRGSSYGHISEWRGEIAINQGMWQGEPDVDAITRIALHPAAKFSPGVALSLGPDAWAPVNSQNTAVRREVIPAYYFFRSARFGDIYQGYLAQACAKHLGHSVRFGTPVVRHERNDHDLLADLEAELPDIRRVEPWLDWLTSAKPEGSTYADAYASLAEQMPQSGKAAEMRTWLKLCRRIG